MKIRSGFVSNSSSASFYIPACWLTQFQEEELLKYGESEENEDGWSIRLNSPEDPHKTISGFTIMDNDAIQKIFDRLGIPSTAVFWECEG